ncbi:uncharacterized protein A4U43_C03F22300 [Asparagus officinalis]|uniref:Uncharacterized protein n=1 Tax=Asparagus officinalis TaxID=4686 RepID=A0A5P1FDX7_ASPOF|nr:uncharacterized protein A4U43_C03F22300 [Asparagus officinalis]
MWDLANLPEREHIVDKLKSRAFKARQRNANTRLIIKCLKAQDSWIARVWRGNIGITWWPWCAHNPTTKGDHAQIWAEPEKKKSPCNVDEECYSCLAGFLGTNHGTFFP